MDAASDVPAARRPGSQVAYRLLTILLIVAAVEGTAYAAYRIVFGQWFTAAAGAEARNSALGVVAGGAAGAEVPASTRQEVVHPFLGFVFDRGVNERENRRALGRIEVGRYGFFEPPGPPPPRPANAYRIAVVGGSAALLFSFQGAETLREGLRDAAFVAGRPVIVDSLALGGFKQPQQLLTVAWMLSLGERFDLIINLDGFNEVVLARGNAAAGVFPGFPRDWDARVANLAGAGAMQADALASSVFWGGLRRSAARWAGAPVVRRSASVAVVWRLVDRWLGHRHGTAAGARAGSAFEAGFGSTGPALETEAHDAILGVVAAQWRDASIQLHRLASANGIRYLHAIQPNQYLDRKPMGPEERARAYQDDHPYRPLVAEGYTRLAAEAPALRAAGVDLLDLTGVFEEDPEPRYKDTCCHVGPSGNVVLARAIVDHLIAERHER